MLSLTGLLRAKWCKLDLYNYIENHLYPYWLELVSSSENLAEACANILAFCLIVGDILCSSWYFTSGSVSKSSNNFGFLPNTNLYGEWLAK